MRMERDSFIIAVLIVFNQYNIIKQKYGLRRGCFALALSDGDVIMMEICGEYLRF